MSSTNEVQLNLSGQCVLTGAASLACNGISHPLSTAQTCLQARVPISGLYRGFIAIYAVDAMAFGVTYVTNDALQRRLGPIGAIVAATALATPFAAIGEGAMQNRQATALSYKDRELWQRAMRPAGMLVMAKRDLFWNGGVFYVTPKLGGVMARCWPHWPSWLRDSTAALLTGAAVGFVTTPVAGIKTMIQTSQESLSIRQAVRKITRPAKPQPDGVFVRKLYNYIQRQGGYLQRLRSMERLFVGAVPRMGYLGSTMAITTLVYRTLPLFLPNSLKK
jgi:hypothetical protein